MRQPLRTTLVRLEQVVRTTGETMITGDSQSEPATIALTPRIASPMMARSKPNVRRHRSTTIAGATECRKGWDRMRQRSIGMLSLFSRASENASIPPGLRRTGIFPSASAFGGVGDRQDGCGLDPLHGEAGGDVLERNGPDET